MKRLLLAALAVVRKGIEDELVGLDEQRKGELATRVPEERRPESDPARGKHCGEGLFRQKC